MDSHEGSFSLPENWCGEGLGLAHAQCLATGSDPVPAPWLTLGSGHLGAVQLGFGSCSSSWDHGQVLSLPQSVHVDNSSVIIPFIP